MDVKLSRKKILIVILSIYMMVCVFFPLDKYSLKPITFICICFLGLPEIIYAIKNSKMLEIFLMGIVFPIIMMLFSFVNNGSLRMAVVHAYPAALILITIPVVILNIENVYENILIKLLFVEAVSILIIVILDLIGVFNVNAVSPFRTFYYEMGMGVMGKSPAYSAYYKIFFKTSPLLIFLLDYSWKNRKWVTVCITFGAILFSGTRANLLVAVIYTMWRLIFHTFKNKKMQIMIGFLFVFVFVFGAEKMLFRWNWMMNTGGSVSSDALRSGQLVGLLEVLKNPWTLFLGAGLGTQFYDYGRLAYISGVELAYLDLLRQIGLILFVPFLIFVFRPIMKKEINLGYRFAYVGYMAIAFTNPLLFTSTAYLAYINIYSKKWTILYNKRKQIKGENHDLCYNS